MPSGSSGMYSLKNSPRLFASIGSPTGVPVPTKRILKLKRLCPHNTGDICSVKTNIGHLESAAGVAGITKVLLMMKYGKMVKSLHFERPNPKINFPKYNMEVSTDVVDWCTLAIDVSRKH
jgi:hypothetical protein